MLIAKHRFFSNLNTCLGAFIYDWVDDTNTSAEVAGSVGAGLERSIVVILGFANLRANGFAMSIGTLKAFVSNSNMVKKYN